MPVIKKTNSKTSGNVKKIIDYLTKEEKSKQITSFNQNKYKAIGRTFEGNYKSYVFDAALSVNKANLILPR